MSLKQLLFSNKGSMKWASAGWCFFLCENVIISENRSLLIDNIGDTYYHSLYGTLSTIAMSMIGYGYINHVKNKPPFLWKVGHSVPLKYSIGGYMCQLIAWCLLGQIMPRLKLPTAIEKDENNETKWKMHCPFDFSDSSKEKELYGINRVTNHPGLWAFGFQCLSWSIVSPSVPTKVCLGFPFIVAYIGGKHSDSRHQRGIGGSWNNEIEGKMGHVPFEALLSGKQGDVKKSFKKLSEEIKEFNLLTSMGISSLLWFVTKKRSSGIRIMASFKG